MKKINKSLIRSWLIISALLLSSAGCATQAVGKLVRTPCPPPPQPPSHLGTKPLPPTFQMRLRRFFLASPVSVTKSLSTLIHAISGLKESKKNDEEKKNSAKIKTVDK